ncbi:hypothetical protein M3Y96_00859100 [Aphelenchoides besseyi]|nr:hypothetical protein M3Y96_00859100 [Aphelenchoides besseyi]
MGTLFSMYLYLFAFILIYESSAVKIIKNGLAPPEIVHSPISTKPRCVINAPPLDLVFILDSSGSLKNKFQDEVDVIRRIVRYTTIGPTATRVMLVQFSGVQHLEFDFNAFDNRDDLLTALDVLRHVSGITRIGGAFEFTLSVMKPEFGLRGPNVKKIVFLLSDGRTHDFPKDAIASEAMRRSIENLSIYAYGTGEYVAMNELINITKDETKIITNKNLTLIEPLFEFWHGIEVCEKQPVCIKGSDKPLDLMLVIDSSDSIDSVFHDQITFAIERIIQNVNIHPEATRLALITYSGKVFVHFTFNDLEFGNNTAVIRHLNELTSIKGTTSTHLALQKAYELFTDPAQNSEVRKNVPKLAIVITDGRSSKSPRLIATRLRAENISVMAITLHHPTLVDQMELETIASKPENIFTPANLPTFESEFLRYIGFGCSKYPSAVIGSDSQPRVRGSTDVTCDANSITFTVRTQKPMNGLMYAQQYHNDPRCVHVANGEDRELSITFVDGTCGVTKSIASTRDGYNFNVTVILQFHPLIVTRADQGLDVTCFNPQPVAPMDLSRGMIKPLAEAQCTYRLHRFSPVEHGCLALDAKVGESIWHKWQCDVPNYLYLVHDCVARSERSSIPFLDSNGCELDQHILETPDYSKFNVNSSLLTSDPLTETSTLNLPYVFQEMSAFKFPGDDNLVFQCFVSLCDPSVSEACRQQIPPRCQKSVGLATRLKSTDELAKHRAKRSTQNIAVRPGFARTFRVETRTLNVLESESIRPTVPVKYCDVRT